MSNYGGDGTIRYNFGEISDVATAIGTYEGEMDGTLNEQTAWKAELVVAPDGVTVLHLAHNDAELSDANAGDIWCGKYGSSRFCGA